MKTFKLIQSIVCSTLPILGLACLMEVYYPEIKKYSTLDQNRVVWGILFIWWTVYIYLERVINALEDKK